MAMKMKDVVLVGLEGSRGTVAGSFQVHLPFRSPGLAPVLTNHLGEVLSSSTWPHRTAQVPLGTTARFTLTPDINVANVRDLILLATQRTDGVLSAVSVAHSQAGIGDAHYLGAVCSALNLEYSRSGAPDAGAILQGSMEFECMKPAATTGVSAGTQAVGRYFKLGAATLTVNSVSITTLLSYRRSITNALALGPPDSSNIRIYLEDGDVAEEISLTVKMTAVARQTLALAGTEHAVAIVHGTGTANETVTETMGACQIESHQLGEADGVVTEEWTIKPHHTGAAVPTVWTFGSSIGATELFAE